MHGARRLVFQTMVLVGTATGAFGAGSTNWTGAGRDGQWANPANWSNGVPDADTVATFYGPDGSHPTVDLGGATRHAAGVSAGTGIGSLVTIRNGTLSTPSVEAISEIQIESRLTTDSPVLTLTPNFILRVTGPIVGPMDVYTAGVLSGASTYTGRTVVRHATEIGGNGVLLNTPLVQVSIAPLTLNADLGFSVPNGTVELHAGRVVVSKPDYVKTLSVAAGTSALTLNQNLETDQLIRTAGATLTLNSPSPVAPLLAGNAAPGVVPWVAMSGPVGESFGVFGAGGFRPFTAAEYSPDLAPSANVRLTGARSQSADVDVNTLTLNGASLQLNGARLRVTGGGLMFQSAGGNSSIRGTGSLALPDTEGVVHAYGAAAVHAIDVPVSGGMLTKTGPGRLVLARQNSYTGGTVMNGGTVQANVAGALGTGPLHFSGGALDLNYPAGTVPNDLVLDELPGFSLTPFSSLTLQPGTTTLAGRISGTGGVTVLGGDVRLTGGGAPEGAYGVFTQSGRTISIDSDLPSPDAVVGTFGGAEPGRIFGNATVGGELRTFGGFVSPGQEGAVGRLTVGRASLNGGTLHAELAGRAPGSGYDQLVVLDHLFLRTGPGLDTVLELVPSGGFAPAPGDRFTLIDNRFTGPVEGAFRNLSEGTMFQSAGTSWQISYRGGDGNDVVVTVVPEPRAVAGLAIGAPLLLRRRRHAGS
jgi:autotransporter-associated beta strand protein